MKNIEGRNGREKKGREKNTIRKRKKISENREKRMRNENGRTEM